MLSSKTIARMKWSDSSVLSLPFFPFPKRVKAIKGEKVYSFYTSLSPERKGREKRIEDLGKIKTRSVPPPLLPPLIRAMAIRTVRIGREKEGEGLAVQKSQSRWTDGKGGKEGLSCCLVSPSYCCWRLFPSSSCSSCLLHRLLLSLGI